MRVPAVAAAQRPVGNRTNRHDDAVIRSVMSTAGSSHSERAPWTAHTVGNFPAPAVLGFNTALSCRADLRMIIPTCVMIDSSCLRSSRESLSQMPCRFKGVDGRDKPGRGPVNRSGTSRLV